MCLRTLSWAKDIPDAYSVWHHFVSLLLLYANEATGANLKYLSMLSESAARFGSVKLLHTVCVAYQACAGAGLEYDLNLFNIVAVSDFNMGAMENKSLNIFNSRLVIASPATSTDLDFARVEGVVAHEYFHKRAPDLIVCSSVLPIWLLSWSHLTTS